MATLLQAVISSARKIQFGGLWPPNLLPSTRENLVLVKQLWEIRQHQIVQLHPSKAVRATTYCERQLPSASREKEWV